MAPDGTPIVSPTAIRDLLLAAGHGTLGWTVACDAGWVIADLVSGGKPEFDVAGLGVRRYRRGQRRRRDRQSRAG
jgi:D-amino-acid dehydrogenase